MIKFDPNEEGSYEIARAVILERLKADRRWEQFDHEGTGFDRFVEYIGDPGIGRAKLRDYQQDVLWEFMIKGIIAPGKNVHNPNPPWFRVTSYGQRVVDEQDLFLPHDPSGFLDSFRKAIKKRDKTVESYLQEALNCFNTGNMVASVVMLGVASERVFLLLCEAFLKSINSPAENSRFKKMLTQNAIKPKMLWVFDKIEEIKDKDPKGLPDNVSITLTSLFDFVRIQRNDLGHPKEIPPVVTREQAYINLRMFPSFYKMSNEVMKYLGKNKV